MLVQFLILNLLRCGVGAKKSLTKNYWNIKKGALFFM